MSEEASSSVGLIQSDPVVSLWLAPCMEHLQCSWVVTSVCAVIWSAVIGRAVCLFQYSALHWTVTKMSGDKC